MTVDPPRSALPLANETLLRQIDALVRERDLLRTQVQEAREIILRTRQTDAAVPQLRNIDIYGITCPVTDDLKDPRTNTLVNNEIGGDHLVWVDFNKRYDLDERIRQAIAQRQHEIAAKLRLNRTRAGIFIADVAGHARSDSVVAFALHHTLLEGVRRDLDLSGEITTRVFEGINTRFHTTASITKYITALYGEIWESGRFRFISAGHPLPLVYSARLDRFVDLADAYIKSSVPIGFQPSEDDVDRSRHPGTLGYKRPYTINEIDLMGAGDILLLYTDGLSEHAADAYVGECLERVVRAHKGEPARELCAAIWEDMNRVAPRQDDTTIVVIKKIA